jgi:hypothetical protein
MTDTCVKHGYHLNLGRCYYCEQEQKRTEFVDSQKSKAGRISTYNIDHRRSLMIGYMQTKIEERDWHAVADAAMDLREIEVEARMTKKFEQREG